MTEQGKPQLGACREGTALESWPAGPQPRLKRYLSLLPLAIVPTLPIPLRRQCHRPTLTRSCIQWSSKQGATWWDTIPSLQLLAGQHHQLYGGRTSDSVLCVARLDNSSAKEQVLLAWASGPQFRHKLHAEASLVHPLVITYLAVSRTGSSATEDNNEQTLILGLHIATFHFPFNAFLIMRRIKWAISKIMAAPELHPSHWQTVKAMDNEMDC